MKSNIRKLRNERNLSQTELAEVIGKTQQTVSHMEKDRDRISIESLITMADYFGVSTDYVLGIEPQEKEPEKENKEAGFTEGQMNILSEENELKDIVNRGNTGKLLYQLILSLLLRSLEEDTSTVSIVE